MIINLFRKEKSGDNLEHKICPEGHVIIVARENVGKDYSDGETNAKGVPVYQPGLYCSECDRTYGLSKLGRLS